MNYDSEKTITTKFLILYHPGIHVVKTTVKNPVPCTYSWNTDDNLPPPAWERAWVEGDSVVTDVVEPPWPIPVHRYHAVFPETETLVWTNSESNIFEAGILRGWDTIGYMCTKKRQ